MNIKTICIFTQSPLAKAPRVVKEANVYAEAGYHVTVYGLWYDLALWETDKNLLHSEISYKAGIDLLQWNSLRSRKIRAVRKLGRELNKCFQIETLWALGYDFTNYLQKLEQEHADLYIGHEEMSMALAKALIQKGEKVAFDFEDWHSKDLLPQDRVYRPTQLLEQLEAYLLKHAVYSYTTSQAMADAMAFYHKSPTPKVIYNSFPASERNHMDHLNKDRKDLNTPSVFWFSQVISPGRGLELLFEAMQFISTPFQLHLRGHISEVYQQELHNKTPPHITLFLHPVVAPEELISRIAEHDLGIAFEETQPESRNYTITNKVFHYLQSGIPMVATETAGQLEVAEIAPQAVIVVKHQAETIGKQLLQLITVKEKLNQMKMASWEAGDKLISFEKMKQKLIGFVNDFQDKFQ